MDKHILYSNLEARMLVRMTLKLNSALIGHLNTGYFCGNCKQAYLKRILVITSWVTTTEATLHNQAMFQNQNNKLKKSVNSSKCLAPQRMPPLAFISLSRHH